MSAKVGDTVRYFQPGVDGILSSWAGSPVRALGDSGSVKTATVTKVTTDAEGTYYDTAEGVLLTDADLR